MPVLVQTVCKGYLQATTVVASKLKGITETVVFVMSVLVQTACKDSSRSQQAKRHRNFSNNTGTTHYDSLQASYWADHKDSHNEVIMTSLQGQ